jgi:hypothetical protein
MVLALGVLGTRMPCPAITHVGSSAWQQYPAEVDTVLRARITLPSRRSCGGNDKKHDDQHARHSFSLCRSCSTFILAGLPRRRNKRTAAVRLMPMRYSELAGRVVARRRSAAGRACQARRLALQLAENKRRDPKAAL